MTLVDRADQFGRPRRPWPTDPTPIPRSPHEEPDLVAAAVDRERAVGIRKALDLIAGGMRGRAEYELQRSIQRQLRIAGLGTLEVVSACPCGGRCAGGVL